MPCNIQYLHLDISKRMNSLCFPDICTCIVLLLGSLFEWKYSVAYTKNLSLKLNVPLRSIPISARIIKPWLGNFLNISRIFSLLSFLLMSYLYRPPSPFSPESTQHYCHCFCPNCYQNDLEKIQAYLYILIKTFQRLHNNLKIIYVNEPAN